MLDGDGPNIFQPLPFIELWQMKGKKLKMSCTAYFIPFDVIHTIHHILLRMTLIYVTKAMNRRKKTCFRIGFTCKVTIFILEIYLSLICIYFNSKIVYIFYKTIFLSIYIYTNNKHKYFLFLIFKLFYLFFLLTNNIKHGVGSINLYKERKKVNERE